MARRKLSPKPYLLSAWFEPLPSAGELDYEAYPFNLPAVRAIDPARDDGAQLRFHPDVTFFVGENGAGKSTILEAIAMASGFSAEGGNKNMRFATTPTDSVSPLHEHVRCARSHGRPENEYFLRAESFFNLATYVDELGYFGTYGGKSLHARSHGEAFMALLLHKFTGNGLYLLDEPEAALSPNRQLAALSAIDQLVQAHSQFIIATHSPILLAYPNAKILHFDHTGIHEIAYEDTEHFAVTKDFLNHYPRRLETLLSNDESDL